MGNKYKFNEFENLRIINSTSLGTSQFLVSLFCEYLISGCGYGIEGNDFYSLIKKKFNSSEVNASDFLCKLLRINEMQDFLPLFPKFNANGKFKETDLIDFLDSSYIEIDDNDNIFSFDGKEFRWPRKFINVIEKDGKKYICVYSCRFDSSAWVKAGSSEALDKALKVNFESLEPKGTIKEEDLVTITEDQFFNSPEAPQDLKELDEDQKRAVSCPLNKNALILAGAGSGKTRCLVSRLAYLHLVDGIPLDKIVLLTFTNNVASEMKERAKGIIEPIYAQYYPTKEALLNISTIDSFFMKIIRMFYKEIGFINDISPDFLISKNKSDKTYLNKKIEILKTLINENGLEGIFSWYFEEQDEAKAFGRMKKLLEKVENYLIGLPVNASGISHLADLYLDWQLFNNQILGFECGTKLIQRALSDPMNELKDKICSLYKCILIDEFQDISRLQNDTFSFFYDGTINFTYCGDDDQTIYGFRGSDNSIIQSIAKKPNVEQIALLYNYRSDPSIVEAGNAILDKVESRAKKAKMKTTLETKNKIHLATYHEDFAELTSEITRLIESGMKPSDILVLFRNANVKDNETGRNINEAELIYSALCSCGVAVNRPEPAFELGPDFDLITSLINILLNNSIVESILKIRSCFGLGSIFSDIYIRNVITGKEEPSKELLALSLLAETIRTSKDTNLADLIDRYSIKAGEIFENKQNEKHSDPMFEALREASIDASMPWPIYSSRRFASFISNFRGKFRDTTSKAKKSSSNGVRINTIHKAKGLQAKVVFIIDLEAGKIPNTARIETDYKNALGELRSVKQSRKKYNDLRSTIAESLILNCLNECKIAGFDAREKELLSNFGAIFNSDFKKDILHLESFAVENLITTYNENITYADNRYERRYKELEKDYGNLVQERDMLLDEQKMCIKNLIEFPQDKIELIDKLKEQIKDCKQKASNLLLRSKQFKKSTVSIRELFKTCAKASSYLVDMCREDELEEKEAELLKQKEKQITEEKRVFYVAVTRAEKSLYLMHLEGTNHSEFVDLIPKSLISNNKLLTNSQRDEIGAEINNVNNNIVDVPIDEIKKDDLVVNIKDENVNTYIDTFIKGFIKEHPYCNQLTGQAKDLFELALKHDCISKMTGLNNELAISASFEKSIISLYEQKCGKGIKGFSTSDEFALKQIISFIKQSLKNCKTNLPGNNTIRAIFNPGQYDDNVLHSLKGLSIMSYFIECNNLGLASQEKKTWGTIAYQNDLNKHKKIFVASIDLMNYRNSVVHDDPSVWPANLMINVFRNYLEIVKNCYR